MSKLAHSNQETMDQIDFKRAIEYGEYDMAVRSPLTAKGCDIYVGRILVAQISGMRTAGIPVEVGEAFTQLFAAAPALLALAIQYRDDLRYPVTDEGSKARRLEAIETVLADAKGDAA